MKNTLDFKKQLDLIKQGQESFYRIALAQRNKFLEESKIASKCLESLQELDLFKIYDLSYDGLFRISGALSDDDFCYIKFIILVRYDNSAFEEKVSFDLILDIIDEDNISEVVLEENYKDFKELFLVLQTFIAQMKNLTKA